MSAIRPCGVGGRRGSRFGCCGWSGSQARVALGTRSLDHEKRLRSEPYRPRPPIVPSTALHAAGLTGEIMLFIVAL